MIAQVPINLEIENRTVQAIIDFDTGFIGFTEKVDNNTIEYYYREGPVEFRKALFRKLEPILADRSLSNFRICRKNSTMRQIGGILKENEHER